MGGGMIVKDGASRISASVLIHYGTLNELHTPKQSTVASDNEKPGFHFQIWKK
jgi:hypothetical protein